MVDVCSRTCEDEIFTCMGNVYTSHSFLALVSTCHLWSFKLDHNLCFAVTNHNSTCIFRGQGQATRLQCVHGSFYHMYELVCVCVCPPPPCLCGCHMYTLQIYQTHYNIPKYQLQSANTNISMDQSMKVPSGITLAGAIHLCTTWFQKKLPVLVFVFVFFVWSHFWFMLDLQVPQLARLEEWVLLGMEIILI